MAFISWRRPDKL